MQNKIVFFFAIIYTACCTVKNTFCIPGPYPVYSIYHILSSSEYTCNQGCSDSPPPQPGTHNYKVKKINIFQFNKMESITDRCTIYFCVHLRPVGYFLHISFQKILQKARNNQSCKKEMIHIPFYKILGTSLTSHSFKTYFGLFLLPLRVTMKWDL